MASIEEVSSQHHANHRVFNAEKTPRPPCSRTGLKEGGEQNLLGAMALENAMLAVDTQSKRLIPVDALEMTSPET